jgi:hypothetical protein
LSVTTPLLAVGRLPLLLELSAVPRVEAELVEAELVEAELVEAELVEAELVETELVEAEATSGVAACDVDAVLVGAAPPPRPESANPSAAPAQRQR